MRKPTYEELAKRVEDLERRVKELEAQPRERHFHYHQLQPVVLPLPQQPVLTPSYTRPYIGDPIPPWNTTSSVQYIGRGDYIS